MTTLNSPIETGVRVLMLLSESFPQALDIDRLVLLDHCLIHSEDVGGPPSLHPPVPIRSGELGLKRRVLEDGLRVMMRAELAGVVAPTDGIQFVATEAGPSFVQLLESEYAVRLRERAAWAVGTFGSLSNIALREQLQRVFSHWTEEFLLLDAEDRMR